MTCDDVELELIGFEQGVLPPELRRELEHHLLECPRCLRSHLALKRQTDQVAPASGPSVDSRDRLRRAVARAVSPPKRPLRHRWERPLAVALATAAVLLALVSTRGMYQRAATAPRTTPLSLQRT